MAKTKGNKYGLDELHSILLRIMKDIDKVCRKHEIPYSLHGGTLLGAIREKGFIEWDDDMDIAMTREAYERFASVYAEESTSFELDTTNTWLPRVVPKGVDNNEEAMVFIDIFIYDSITENFLGQRIKFFLTRLLQGMLKKNTEYADFSLLERVLLKATYLLGKPFSRETKLRWHKYVSEKMFPGDGKVIHRSNDSFDAIAIILDNDIMSEYMDIEFEDADFMVSAQYERILISSYGEDYMTPPPEEERKPAHEVQRIKYFI